MSVLIEAKAVAKRFGNLEVLSDITFSVPAKTFTCIVGPSGCGKTTLLRMLLGFETATAGEIVVRSGDASNTEPSMAYIPQKSLLLPWRTALQNVALGLEAKSGKTGQLGSKPMRRGRVTAANIDYLQALINRYGLRGFEHTFPEHLSGGMEQRVSILRAFARDPEILICDEPFSSVDFVTRLKLNSEFRDLCNSSGTTVVFVTHNIEEALYFADELLVLSGRPARIVTRYTPRFTIGSEDPVNVRKDPEFARLFGQIWEDLEAAYAGH